MQHAAIREATAERLRHALELFDDALDMLRLSIQRKHPDISDLEIERRVDLWLTESRPNADEAPDLAVSRRR